MIPGVNLPLTKLAALQPLLKLKAGEFGPDHVLAIAGAFGRSMSATSPEVGAVVSFVRDSNINTLADLLSTPEKMTQIAELLRPTKVTVTRACYNCSGTLVFDADPKKDWAVIVCATCKFENHFFAGPAGSSNA